MVEVGGRPLLWHIMKLYSHFGFNEFILPLGYKGYVIKEYFMNYYNHSSDITIDIANNSIDIHRSASEPWKITLVDTGLHTMTGGRVKMLSTHDSIKIQAAEFVKDRYFSPVTNENINKFLCIE